MRLKLNDPNLILLSCQKIKINCTDLIVDTVIRDYKYSYCQDTRMRNLKKKNVNHNVKLFKKKYVNLKLKVTFVFKQFQN